MRVLFVVNTIHFIDPLGIMLLSALAKNNGHEVSLGILQKEDVLDKINKMKPNMVCYSTTTGEHTNYLRFNEEVKKRHKNIFTIMGGPHPTFFPKVVGKGGLDAICKGEGDEAFVELLNTLENGGDAGNIPNILLANNGGKGAELRPFYQDLDRLPFPDRNIIYDITEMGEFPIKSFITTRGCPYHCTYCFNYSYQKLYEGKGKFLRRHSVERVIAELHDVRSRYPLEFVKFYDDIFVYEIDDWLLRFVELYKKEINLPFQCYTRVNLVKEDIVKLLKEAGCRSVSMSIEAGNPEVREKLLKRKMTNDQVIKGFHLFHKYGISTFCNNIVALPNGGMKDDIETLDLNIKAKVTYALFSSYYPYPGTELGEYCIDNNLVDGTFDIYPYYQNRSPLNCFDEKEKELLFNFSELATVVVAFPWMRNIAIRFLIHLPNAAVFLLYFFVQGYLLKTKIYPAKMGFWKSLKFFLMGIKWELLKRPIRV